MPPTEKVGFGKYNCIIIDKKYLQHWPLWHPVKAFNYTVIQYVEYQYYIYCRGRWYHLQTRTFFENGKHYRKPFEPICNELFFHVTHPLLHSGVNFPFIDPGHVLGTLILLVSQIGSIQMQTMQGISCCRRDATTCHCSFRTICFQLPCRLLYDTT